MNINELAFDVALWGDFGEFNKIHDLGWSTKEEFLSGMEEMKGVKWIDMADGRKIMSVPHSFGEAGLDCRFIVVEDWVATYQFSLLEAETRLSKTRKPNHQVTYDDEDDDWVHYDDEPHQENHAIEDTNGDYGWWR